MSVKLSIHHPLSDFDLHVDLTIPNEGVTALFGPSGAGKTTIMLILAGLIEPVAGHIQLDGETLLDTEADISIPAYQRGIGSVFQEARLFPHRTVAGNLDYAAKRASKRDQRTNRKTLTSILGLEPLLARKPDTLSGGEKQRVALGRTLLSQPRLLLMDEPLSALDQGRRSEILPYLERLRDEVGIPILYISHAVDEVARLADRMIVLNRGEVAAQGPIEDVMGRLDLFPLTGRFEAGAVLNTRVASHNDPMKMSMLNFEGGRFLVPLVQASVGAPVRVRIRARDVILALEEPKLISANNILSGTISDIREESGAYLDVQVTVGTDKILARITRLSRERLGGLAIGTPVYALIKSVSVERHNGLQTTRQATSEAPKKAGP